MQGTRGSRLFRLIRNIVLYSLAACGLFFVLLIIFIPKSAPKTAELPTATSLPKKLIILVPTNTPSPTVVPTNTAIPTNTPIPTATDTPNYREALMIAVGDLSPSMIAVTEMLDHPQYGNEQWIKAIDKELDTVDAVYDKVTALAPPKAFENTHNAFVFAASRCKESSQHYRAAVDNNNPSEVSIGTALLNSCAEQIRLAGNLLKNVR